jgi:hypothetical protein
LQQRGVDIDAMLLVQPAARNHQDRLWTVEQVIRSGSSSGVLAWLAAADHVALRRLQLAAEEHGCWTVLFRPLAARHERSPAALRIGVSQSAVTTRVQIDKCRGAVPGVIDITEELNSMNRIFDESSLGAGGQLGVGGLRLDERLDQRLNAHGGGPRVSRAREPVLQPSASAADGWVAG